jgi:two-component sensor histidine kinase
MEVAGSNLLNESTVKAIVVHYHDITQRKEEELRILLSLQDTERALNDIHQRVQHNLNTIAQFLAATTRVTTLGKWLENIADKKIVSMTSLSRDDLPKLERKSRP